MENGWEDVSDECFLYAYDTFVREAIDNNNKYADFDCCVSDSQIMAGMDKWAYRILEGPLVASSQVCQGQKSFTDALSLADEIIKDDTTHSVPKSLEVYLKEATATIVSEVNVNDSDEQKIDIAHFITAYDQPGQSGLHDFIIEKSTELIYGLLEAFFIKGVRMYNILCCFPIILYTFIYVVFL
ncbi:uncharacterized protein LOC141532134 [Cotesia typhae]|uniref:uncharacterized protein LOC141532134 n=1 Tax=Cotesia typhae TaxID=2053667 RepID=UPI003D693476